LVLAGTMIKALFCVALIYRFVPRKRAALALTE